MSCFVKADREGLSKHRVNERHPRSCELIFSLLLPIFVKAIKISVSADALDSVSCTRIAASLASLDSPHKIPCIVPTSVPRRIVASNHGGMQELSNSL